MRLWAEVFTPHGIRVGLVDLVSLTTQRRIDELGSIKLTVPATNPNAVNWLQVGRLVYLYDDRRLVGQGYLLKKSLAVGASQLSTSWDGIDSLEALRRINVGRGRVYQDEDFGDVIRDLLGLVGGWRVVFAGEQPSTPVSIRFDGVSVWRAITQVATKKGVHVRIGNSLNTIEVGGLGLDSEVRILSANRGNVELHQSNVALIERLDLVLDGFDIYNVLEPIIGGDGGAILNLKRSSRSSPYPITTRMGPDGRLVYELRDEASIEAYGEIQRTLPLSGAIPVESSYAAVTAAADLLYDWAAPQLKRRSVPQKAYRCTIKNLGHVIKAGDKVHLWYQGEVYHHEDVVDYADIDDYFWVLTVDEDLGRQSVNLTLSNVDIPLQEAAAALAGGMAEIKDGQVGVTLSFQTRKPEWDVTLDLVSSTTIQLLLSPGVMDVTKALLTLTRENYTGPDTLSITVDGLPVTGGPWLGGSSGDTVTIDIEPYLMNSGSGVDLSDPHTIIISNLYQHGALNVVLDLEEVVAKVE